MQCWGYMEGDILRLGVLQLRYILQTLVCSSTAIGISKLLIDLLEPLFYLHHTNLDRIWWKWQSANPQERLYEISGPIRPWVDVLGPNYTDLPYGNVTLDFEIQLGRLGGVITVGDVMHTKGDFLCYEYV